MNYNKTPKAKLIEMLKTSQSECARLAALVPKPKLELKPGTVVWAWDDYGDAGKRIAVFIDIAENGMYIANQNGSGEGMHWDHCEPHPIEIEAAELRNRVAQLESEIKKINK